MSQEPGRQRARQRLSAAMGGEVDPFETEDLPSVPAPTTPDTFVWISTPRAGIAHHVIAEGFRKTNCGRYIGTETEVLHGYVMPLAEVLDRFGYQPCKTCNGSSVPPVVVSGGRL